MEQTDVGGQRQDGSDGRWRVPCLPRTGALPGPGGRADQLEGKRSLIQARLALASSSVTAYVLNSRLVGSSRMRRGHMLAEPVATWFESLGLEASVFRRRLNSKHPGPFGAVRTEVAARREGASLVRARHISRPGSLGVTPGARRAASRSGAQPAHLQRPPRSYRRHAHRTPMLAWLVPLLARCST
jgi:hypothetical protein